MTGVYDVICDIPFYSGYWNQAESRNRNLKILNKTPLLCFEVIYLFQGKMTILPEKIIDISKSLKNLVEVSIFLESTYTSLFLC